MKRSAILKLLIILVTLSAILLLVACDKNNEGSTETAGTQKETVLESDTETETESDVGGDQTESEGGSDESESESESDETETTCVHPYDAKPEGHWKPACDVCGKKDGKLQDHEYVEYQEDEGDLIYYSYVCTVCGYEGYGQEVPYEINLFFPASEIANAPASGSVEGVYNFISGVGFGTFGIPADGMGSNTNITIEDSGSIEDDPAGQYMAVRVRLPRSQTGISLQIKSVHADSAFTYKITGLKPGWITLAFDLSKINKAAASGGIMGYVPDQDGEFYLEKIVLSSYIGAGESLDISYVVFCEEKEDLDTFIGKDTNCYYYADAFNKEPERINFIDCVHDYIIDEENGTHTLENPCFICGTIAVYDEPHTFVEISGNGKNSFECSVCGFAKYYKVVPDEVNKYYSASELNAGGIIYYPYTGFNHGMYVETGDAYTRYDGPINFKDKVAQVIFARDDKDQNPVNNGDAENGIRINVGDAIYFVLRVRVNTDGLSPLNVTISTTGHAGFDSKEGNSSFSIPLNSTPKDTWNTYVINLAEVFPTKYIKDEASGDYIVDTFYFTMCSGTFEEGVTLDLSYMAYCSTWGEVAGLVDEDQLFYLTNASGNGNWVSTDTRGCVTHVPGDANVVEKDGKVTYQFICSNCGEPAVSKTVDSSVTRYYYPGEISTSAKTYFQLNGAASGKGAHSIYDEVEDIVFSRFTGYRDSNGEAGLSPVTGQALWQRAQADMWAGQTSSAAEQYTENVGNAEWLVVRARSSDAKQNFSITYSTTMYNAAEGAALNRLYGGMISVVIPFGAASANEWATYVVNLKDIDPVSYVKDDMGTPGDPTDDQYVIDSFYLNFAAFPLSVNVDIEYIAFVEGSWAELDALIKEETVVVISDRTGSYGMADVKTGKCLEGHHAYGHYSNTEADGSVTNKTLCAVCGDVMREQHISADVNKYFDISNIGCYYQTDSTDPSKNNSDAKVAGIFVDNETGDRFVRIAASFGNTHINLNGGNMGGALSTYTIDTGRYAVLKFRSGGRGFAFDAQTGDFAAHSNSVYTALEEDEGKWLIFVIDLSVYQSGVNSSGNTYGYTVNSEQTVKFRLTTNGTDRDADGWYLNDPYTMDIAYLAIVDDIGEAESVIGDEEYRLYNNGLENEYEIKNAD